MKEYKTKNEENDMVIMPAYFVLAEAYISDDHKSEERSSRLKRAEDFLFVAFCAYIK